MELTISRIVKGWAANRTITPATEGFILNGRGRKYAKELSDSNWLDAFAAFDLVPSEVEPDFGIFTGVHFLEGAHTHIHQDTAPEGMAHVRCNVMVKKPAVGGHVIVGDQTLEVDVGDLWIVFASLEQHGSTPISGSKRVIKSFGGLVPLEQATQLMQHLGEQPHV